MKKTALLEEVIHTVHEHSVNHYDDTVPIHDMRFESLERMDISGQSFGVLPSAQKLFANRLRVPHSYLMRCPAELQKDNLQYWLDREARTETRSFVGSMAIL